LKAALRVTRRILLLPDEPVLHCNKLGGFCDGFDKSEQGFS
jgi:hypothetical protein